MTEHTEAMKLLQKHFDIALETPDGVKKLRALILTLAMQGKLVKQDPKDQPASELIKEIQAEKERLIKEGKIKKQKELSPINPDEVPYEVPKGWVWTRLGEVATQITDGTHHTPTYVDSGIPFLSVKDMSSGVLDFSTTRYISQEEHDELKKRCYPQRGDLLLTKVGTTGIPVLVNTNQEFSIFVSVALIKYVNKYISGDFLVHLVNSPLLKKQSAEGTEGVGNKNLVLRKINAFLFPLPPLAEQKRIVVKIDELMALCDKLEAERTARDQKRLNVHTAAINRLLVASAPENFDKSWQFITKHFSELYAVPANVTELKKAILQLAVMGKLVPQDPNDQPASELLKEIEAEKKRLIKAGKIRKQELLLSLKSEDIHYELPEGWATSCLLQLGYFLGGKTPSTNRADFWNGNIPWVTPKDMKTVIIQGSQDHVTQLGVESGLILIPLNSILMVVRSGILRRIFPVAINAVHCTVNQDLKVLVPYNHEMSSYLLLMLQGFESLILSKLTKKGVTVESVVVDEFIKYKFPLPPIAEQKRIVARIDQLMELCDALQQQLAAATGKQSAILNAVLAKI